GPAVRDAFKKLNPRVMAKNPVMFVVEVGCILVTALFVMDLGRGARVDVLCTVQLIAWLWFPVLFATFAEAMAEGRGTAQAGTLEPFSRFFGGSLGVAALVALLVCLIPTTIGGLLSAIGIAGMDRLVQHNVLAMSGRAVEAAGDIDVLMLDKTGTITYGNRQATRFVPLHSVDEREVAHAAMF